MNYFLVVKTIILTFILSSCNFADSVKPTSFSQNTEHTIWFELVNVNENIKNVDNAKELPEVQVPENSSSFIIKYKIRIYTKDSLILVNATEKGTFSIIGVPNTFKTQNVGEFQFNVSPLKLGKEFEVNINDTLFYDNDIIPLSKSIKFSSPPKSEFGITIPSTFQPFFIVLCFIIYWLLLRVIILIIYKPTDIEDSEKDANCYERIIPIPKELKSSLQQYFMLFSEYVKSIKKQSIIVLFEDIEKGLLIKIKFSQKINKMKIETWFDEYGGFLKSKVNEIVFEVEEGVKDRDADIFRIKLESQIDHLRTRFKLAQLENEDLKKTNVWLRELARSLSDKNIEIQIINGGHQQFADRIEITGKDED